MLTVVAVKQHAPAVCRLASKLPSGLDMIMALINSSINVLCGQIEHKATSEQLVTGILGSR